MAPFARQKQDPPACEAPGGSSLQSWLVGRGLSSAQCAPSLDGARSLDGPRSLHDCELPQTVES